MKTYYLFASATFCTSSVLFCKYLLQTPKSWVLTIFTILFVSAALYNLKRYFNLTMSNTIEQRAEAEYPLSQSKIYTSNLFTINNRQKDLQQAYIAGATEERALIDEQFRDDKSLVEIVRQDSPTSDEDVAKLMQIYASYQTASLEERVKELEEEKAHLIDVLTQVIAKEDTVLSTVMFIGKELRKHD